jgi:hypothetical protein
MSVRHLFARLSAPKVNGPISTPDLHVPIRGKLSVDELERLAEHANHSIAAVERELRVAFDLLVSNLRASAPSSSHMALWISNARIRFVDPIRKNAVYLASWEAQVEKYATLLPSMALFCSQFDGVARRFTSIEERLGALRYHTDTLIGRAIEVSPLSTAVSGVC